MPKKKAIIRVLDEVNALVLGLTEEDTVHFFEKFGLLVKGAMYLPIVKLGRWDGKVRFFSKNGKTYVQLLEEIVPELELRGYQLELIDDRPPVYLKIPVIDKNYLADYQNPLYPDQPLVLGDHQVDAVNAVTESNMGIVIGGTGAGKSIIAATLCNLYKRYMNYKCLIIVPTDDLVSQTSEDIALYGNDTGIYSGSEKDLNHDHVVSTWQALQHNKHIAATFHVIIVDECHGVKATVIKEIINEYATKACVKLGLTGTLPEYPCDAMSVRVSLGNVLYRIPAHMLIQSGWLATLKLKVIELVENFESQWAQFQIDHPKEARDLTYKKWKDNYFPEYTDEMNYLKGNDRRNDVIVGMIERARDARGNCLVLVNGVAYGKRLAKKIPGAYFVNGADEKAVRREIYDLFSKENDVVLITSFQIGSTGLNIRRIFNLFLIDAGKTFERVIQSIGRGLRKASDKDTVHVFDIGSDLRSSHKHVNERKRIFKKEQYEFEYSKIDYTKC
jgi:superfamily II DNA or RNA helicase